MLTALALLATPAQAFDLPLEHVDYEIDVVGPVAEITVRQTWRNPSDTFIEGTYVFPLQPDAAVNDLVMRVADREIRSELRTREAARQLYEEARDSGHTAALTEQERPNLFTQSVANLPPHEAIEVELHVVQPLTRVDGQWELVVPLVVGPRFLSGHVPDPERVSPPVSPVDTGLRATLDVHAALGQPAATITSPTHTWTQTRSNDGFDAKLVDVPLTRDAILRWTPRVNEPVAVALREGDHVLVMLEAPDAPPRDQIVPREIVWVVDTSCSMSGEPLNLAKRAMDEAFAGMDARDAFTVLDFNSTVSSLSATPLPATPENIARGRAYVQAFQGEGGTDMLSGIKAALDLPSDPRRQRFVAFLTDGYIGDEQQILATIEDRRGKAHLFAFGLGSSVNRYLLDEMARSGQGQVRYTTLDEAPEDAVGDFLDTIGKPVLTDVGIRWGGGAVATPDRVPGLFAGQPLYAVAEVPRTTAAITVTGRLGRGAWSKTIPVVDVGDGDGLATLWARGRIGELERTQHWGEIPEVHDEIVNLALQHRILTKYTSFVAVDRVVSNRTGELRHVDVPQTIPDGVTYEATVSRPFTPPGDPLLTVEAPADARSVTAYFPWGELATLRWDPLRGRWFYRFLVPHEAQEGVIEVPVVIVDADGRVHSTSQTVTVDGEAPELEVDVVIDGGKTTVTVHAEEPLRRIRVQPAGRPDKAIDRSGLADAPVHVFVLDGEWPDIDVVAKDLALNTITVEAAAAE